MTLESCSRIAWEQPLDSIEPPGQLRIVGLFENHSPKVRRAFDQFDVTFGNDFSMEGRKELHQIKPLDGVLRMFGAPRFLQSRRRSDVSSAGSHRCNQYSHRVTDVALNRG